MQAKMVLRQMKKAKRTDHKDLRKNVKRPAHCSMAEPTTTINSIAGVINRKSRKLVREDFQCNPAMLKPDKTHATTLQDKIKVHEDFYEELFNRPEPEFPRNAEKNPVTASEELKKVSAKISDAVINKAIKQIRLKKIPAIDNCRIEVLRRLDGETKKLYYEYVRKIWTRKHINVKQITTLIADLPKAD